MKTRSKKALALLLSLLMLISLFGGLTLVSADEVPTAYFQAVDDFTVGQPVMIAAEHEGLYYALTYNGSALVATLITVDSGYETASGAVDNSALWKLNDAGLLENVAAPGIYLRGGSSLVADSRGDRAIDSYDSGNKAFLVYKTSPWVMTFNGTSFGTAQNSGATALLFTPVVYQPATAFEVGLPTIIVAEHEGACYALAYNGSALVPKTVPIGENGVYGIAPDADVVWLLNDAGLLESAAAPGIYLRGGSSLVADSRGDRAIDSYDSENKAFLVYKTSPWVMTFNGTSFGTAQNSGATAYIYSIPSAAAKFTITFNANADGVTGLTGTKTEGIPYEISETLSRDGYAFEGWNTKDDGSGTAYAVGSTITEDADLTLYAVWTEVVAETYERTTELTEHYEYVVVAELNGKYYALSYDGSIGIEEVTVEGDTVTTDQLALRWILSEDNELESAAKSGTFLYPYSSGMTYSSGRKLEYDEPVLHFPTSSAIGYVTFDGTKFGYSNNEEDAANISLFVREIEWVEPPQTEPAPIPAPDTITRDAVKNADGSITLAFTSDTHHDTRESVNPDNIINLQTWLEAADIGYIDAFGFCGDMASAYLSGSAFWDATAMVIGYMDGLEKEGKVGNSIYTHGNHEWFPSAGGDYGNVYETNATAQRLMQVGAGLETEDYIIYCFGAGEIAATMKYDYNVYDVEKMAAYLETAPTGIPIFILTHFPIHEWYGRGEERYMKHADPVIDALNAASESGHQIIVLWGHNHSDYDDNYYAPVYPGDEIVINPAGDKRTLQFTYLAAGCTADAEYTGPSAGSAACMNKGLVVTINPDKTLTYTYYTMDGMAMNVESPWMVRFRDNQEYKVFYTPELVKTGDTVDLFEAAKAAPEIEGYDLVGWTTWENGKEVEFDFDVPITRNQLVTAVYEEFIDESAGDMTVYMTVSVNGEMKVTAEPLAIAPGSSYDEALKALHEKYAETDSSIVYKASSSNDYNMYLIETVWGLDGTPYTILNGETLSETVDSVRLHEGDNLIVIATNTSPVLSIGATIKDETTATLEVISWALDVETFTYSTEPYANATVTNKAGEVVGTTDDKGCIDVAYPGDYVVEKSAIHVDAYEVAESAVVEYTFDPNTENLDPVVVNKDRYAPFGFNSVPVPEREGYSFQGWNTKRDGTGETFQISDTVGVNVKLTFYAIWQEIEEMVGEEEEGTPSGGGSSGSSSSGTEKPPVETAVEIAEQYQDQNVEVTFVENTDGSITIDVTADGQAVELKNGVKVALAAELEPGQVLVIVNEDGTETVVRKSAAEDGVLTALLDGGATVKIVDNAKEFNDVAEDAWYADAVDFVSSHELFVGDENGNFNPQDTMTRAMMAMVMFRLEGEPEAGEGKSFADVEDGKWYSEAISWASAEGVMNGYGESFGVNDPVTREQMAVLLYNYVQSQGIEVKKGSTSGFSDAGEIHSWAADAMAWAVEEGIFQGDGQGKLNPTGEATRADVATLMQRVVKLLLK